jgi:uracil DNA glycosylase
MQQYEAAVHGSPLSAFREFFVETPYAKVKMLNNLCSSLNVCAGRDERV